MFDKQGDYISGRIPILVARKAMQNNNCKDADIYRCPFLKAKCAKTDVHTMCPKTCGICGKKVEGGGGGGGGGGRADHIKVYPGPKSLKKPTF